MTNSADDPQVVPEKSRLSILSSIGLVLMFLALFHLFVMGLSLGNGALLFIGLAVFLTGMIVHAIETKN